MIQFNFGMHKNCLHSLLWIEWFRSTDLKCMGFQEIICVSVNDPFVMSAWGDAKGATDKVIASIIEIFKKFLELSSKQKKSIVFV